MKKIIHYNAVTFIVFTILISSALTFFSFADDSGLTIFDDFDRDGISNAEEETLGTNPKIADSDGDGYSDGVEVESGYNPLIPAPGDRIMQEKEPIKFAIEPSQTENITKKISEDVVSYIADVQESGDPEITAEDFSQVLSNAIDEEVQFASAAPIDISKIQVKEQSCDDPDDDECREELREDAIEYFTAVSYIFVSNFPQGFFDRPTDVFEAELMSQMNNFSGSLTQFSYFEQLAEDALAAEEQMSDLTVPEEMLDVHTQGLYLLQYAGNIYESGDYKKVNTDATPMIATLAQMQGLIELSVEFQDSIIGKLEKYEIEDVLFEF